MFCYALSFVNRHNELFSFDIFIIFFYNKSLYMIKSKNESEKWSSPVGFLVGLVNLHVGGPASMATPAKE